MEKTDKFNMRVSPDFTSLVDEWRRRQTDIPSRAEAIRRLVNIGIAENEYRMRLKHMLRHMATLEQRGRLNELDVRTYKEMAEDFEALEKRISTLDDDVK